MSDNAIDPVERVWVMDSTYAEYMRRPAPSTSMLPDVHVRVFRALADAWDAARTLYNADERKFVSITSRIVEGPTITPGESNAG